METLFIGGGNMATALAGGMLAKGARAESIRIVEPLADARERIASRLPQVRLFAATVPDAVRGIELAVLAVKPQQVRDAAQALAPFVDTVPVVLSIAAGIRVVDLSRWLGGYRRIVRSMPNTPALVGAGISGAFAAPDVDGSTRERAASVLAAAGEIVWCEREEALDGITGVSGSGPAYVFYFLEALERAAAELGFSAADARRLACATFEGAIKLAQSSNLPPATLRVQVTSKGGTTERAIATMDAARLQDVFVHAVKAAAERARELGDTFSQ